MKKILILFAALISFQLNALPGYEDTAEKLDLIIKKIDYNADNAECAPLLFNLCSLRYQMGTSKLINYLSGFASKTKNPALHSLAYGLKDEIEVFSAKKEKYDYIKTISAVLFWKVSKQKEFGYNDIHSCTGEMMTGKNIIISSSEGYFISDNYLSSFSGTAVLDSSVSAGADGILMMIQTRNMFFILRENSD